MGTKVCYMCKVEKVRGEFYKNKARCDLLSSECKSCSKERARDWFAKNTEKVKLLAAKWRAENPEKVKLLAAQWYAENREKVRAKSEGHKDSLADCYVRNKLRTPNPPQELIELKRLQLQIIREIKQQGK